MIDEEEKRGSYAKVFTGIAINNGIYCAVGHGEPVGAVEKPERLGHIVQPIGEVLDQREHVQWQPAYREHAY